jgi:hypothetical protein
VYSVDSVGVIIAATDGPTSVSESESSWVEGIVGPGSDGPGTGDGLRFWGGEGRVEGDSVSSSFRFRLASLEARMCGGS